MQVDRLLALRTAIVLPGAFAEGVLAVVLPWFITQAALGTAWLGVLSALLVASGIVGTVLATPVSRRLGSWRMTVYAAVCSSLCIVGGAVLWLADEKLAALLLALCAMAADTMADLGFSSRTPVIARLYKLPLLKFFGGNWMWAIVGFALGGSVAGWCISANHMASLLGVLSVSSIIVTLSLPKIFPRDARRLPEQTSHWRALLPAGIWTKQVLVFVICIVLLSFIYGPMDNLLVPAQLASHHRPASVFGMLVTAGGLGLTAGLAITQTQHAQSAAGKMWILWLGIAAAMFQILLMWWLPGNELLIAGTFLTAAVFAPAMPMIESTLLLAVKAPSRTVMLAIVGTLASAGDMLGTVVAGWAVQYAGVGGVLAGCALALCPVLVYLYTMRSSFSRRP